VEARRKKKKSKNSSSKKRRGREKRDEQQHHHHKRKKKALKRNKSGQFIKRCESDQEHEEMEYEEEEEDENQISCFYQLNKMKFLQSEDQISQSYDEKFHHLLSHQTSKFLKLNSIIDENWNPMSQVFYFDKIFMFDSLFVCFV